MTNYRCHVTLVLHGSHSPLRSSQMVVDTALERAEAELSNAVSTSAWIVDTALERPEAELSNAVSTSAWIVDTALERAEAELSNAVSTSGTQWRVVGVQE